jgi:integrase
MTISIINDHQYHRGIDLPSARGTSPPKGRALREEEIQTLFAYCAGDTPCQIRDRARLAILYGGGLRRAEAAAAMVGDYDPSTRALKIMHGKGDKYRMVYLAGNPHLSLVRWLDLRSHVPGPLLLRVKGGRVLLQGITPQAILKILQRLASKTEVDVFSPHDLRRTFITELISRWGIYSLYRALLDMPMSKPRLAVTEGEKKPSVRPQRCLMFSSRRVESPWAFFTFLSQAYPDVGLHLNRELEQQHHFIVVNK